MIEARAKDKRGNWEYGAFFVHETRQICPCGEELKPEEIKYLIIQDGFADWNMPKNIKAIEVDPGTVGRDSGMKDRKGIKIFEGDIVLHGLSDTKAAVQVADGCFETIEESGKRDYLKCDVVNRSIEVIGNIHDNPDMFNRRLHQKERCKMIEETENTTKSASAFLPEKVEMDRIEVNKMLKTMSDMAYGAKDNPEKLERLRRFVCTYSTQVLQSYNAVIDMGLQK